VPIPGITAAPFHPGVLHQRLGDFPPCPDFEGFGGKAFEQGLVAGIEQGIILEQEGAAQAVLLHNFDLFDDRIIQHLLGNPLVARFAQAYKIDDIDNFWGVFACLRRFGLDPRRLTGGIGKQKGDCR